MLPILLQSQSSTIYNRKKYATVKRKGFATVEIATDNKGLIAVASSDLSTTPDLDSSPKQIWTPPNNVAQKSTLPLVHGIPLAPNLLSLNGVASLRNRTLRSHARRPVKSESHEPHRSTPKPQTEPVSHEVRLNTIKSISLTKREDEFMPWAEIDLVLELLKRRMLVQCKMYKMELKKKTMSLRILSSSIGLSNNYGLPLLVLESLVIGFATDDILQLTWTEGCIASNQGTTAPNQEEEEKSAKATEKRILAIDLRVHEEEQPAPEAKETVRIEQHAQEHVEELSRVVQNVEEIEAVDSVEHQAHDEEENQAQEKRRRAGSGGGATGSANLRR
ncbi:hypothetical protein F511_25971 [Dorcoceras hygrometricum]|uniref:Uncharacterized protein n=1 Tax=Dorcoceras hygrometricum TaxID=472368 RepID=A0A2Z7AGJ6_9LAMI|nr:hypothetical protein F511_25971 [Dorcoceras hygrometricum]